MNIVLNVCPPVTEPPFPYPPPTPTPTDVPATTPTYEGNDEGKLLSFDLDTRNSTFNDTVYARATCAIEAGKNVTEEYGLDEIWLVYELPLQQHLVNLLNCASAESEEAVTDCYWAEIPAIDATYIAFLGAVKKVCLGSRSSFKSTLVY